MVDDVCVVCVQEWGEVAPGHQHAAERGMYGNVTGTGIGIGSVGDVGHGTDRVTDEDTRTTGSTDDADRSPDHGLDRLTVTSPAVQRVRIKRYQLNDPA